MINKKKYFIIALGVLVSIISVLPFVRPHKTLNNSTTLSDSNQISSNTSSVNSETKKLNQELIIPDANKLLKVKDNSDNKLLAKAENSQKPLSRGGSISSVIKASSSKVAWPLRGSITSPFGIRSRDKHTGIDISASIGTPIKAASNGKVVYAGWQDGYGNLLIIQASSGLQTYYAHTSKILVNVGQTISEGQVVAEVGMSGRTTGPHLHFEVRKNGSPVNPLDYLR